MKCFVENCIGNPVGISEVGFVCHSHFGMLPKIVKKLCMNCNSESCVHVKDGIIEEGKLTSDGKPETLGVSVSENIKMDDRMA